MQFSHRVTQKASQNIFYKMGMAAGGQSSRDQAASWSDKALHAMLGISRFPGTDTTREREMVEREMGSGL